MGHSHLIRCTCGAFTGSLDDPPWTNRVVCYCDDCQAFAAALGRAADILDDRGGSDIVQTAPRAVSFTTGREHLACLRLTPKGPLRWYVSCCNTPIGNTPATPRLAFVGLLHNCLGTPERLDATFGPPRMRAFTRFALGDPKPRQRIPLTAAAGFIWHLAGARLSGGFRRTPFFDGAGAPVVAPTSPGQRPG